MKEIILYDASLREGAQEAGASYTVEDKLRILQMLDELGVQYVEGGNPGSNPKDEAFFARVREVKRNQTRLVAFGSTCRAGVAPAEDANVQALLRAQTDTVAIFGKCWDFHATDILHIDLEQNLGLIHDTVRYLKQQGKEVIFDAEHFFDGYKNNAAYAVRAVQAAEQAGADWLALCDTNGACFPHEIETIVQSVRAQTHTALGIHTHNDTGMANANVIAAVRQGATMVQLTLNGIGERCGNANLWTCVPNLQLKLGYHCIPEANMKRLYACAHAFEDIANYNHNPKEPYVGKNAFAHKAGMHIDAVKKASKSFEHIPPESVGATRRVLVSEQAGRNAILERARTIDPSLTKESPQTQQILDRMKEMEFEGYQFEQADASFELLVRRITGKYHPFFTLKDFRVVVEEPSPQGRNAYAMIEVEVDNETEITAAMGNGPVNALDRAARKALERFYPELKEMYLSDYKVRVLDSEKTTSSVVRVVIESRDPQERWTTVGVSGDVIQASWIALVDSLEYKLLKDTKKA